MTLKERYESLTPEQREQLIGIKTAVQLEAFLIEHKLELSEEEKTQVVEYIEKGIFTLADEELENVAGGDGVCFNPDL